MIVYNCQQNTEEWYKLRLGIPTSSNFHKILTPSKLELSAQAELYAEQLAGEWTTLENDESGSSGFMDRGKELEPKARKRYADIKNVKVATVGFITNDAGTVGCSPDGLVDDDKGGLEIKAKSQKVHAGHIFRPEKFANEHRMQLQGSLWVTGFEYWDLMGFHPILHEVIIRVVPEPEVFEALEKEMPKFLELIEYKKDKLICF